MHAEMMLCRNCVTQMVSVQRCADMARDKSIELINLHFFMFPKLLDNHLGHRQLFRLDNEDDCTRTAPSALFACRMQHDKSVMRICKQTYTVPAQRLSRRPHLLCPRCVHIIRMPRDKIVTKQRPLRRITVNSGRKGFGENPNARFRPHQASLWDIECNVSTTARSPTQRYENFVGYDCEHEYI